MSSISFYLQHTMTGAEEGGFLSLVPVLWIFSLVPSIYSCLPFIPDIMDIYPDIMDIYPLQYARLYTQVFPSDFLLFLARHL